MTEEKWQDIKGSIKDKFSLLQEKIEPIELKVGLTEKQKIGEKEVLVFQSPLGKIKLEYLVKPVVLDKKEHYTKRMGTTAQTEYVLSDSEFVRRMEAWQWNEENQDWQKIDSSRFS